MPLLAFVLGPVTGHCSQEQLDVAMKWWTCALPAWPRWVEALKKAGVPRKRKFLLRTTSCQPTPLIPLFAVTDKHPGIIPQFPGRIQSESIERDDTVAWEVYACVAYLQSPLAETDF